VCCRSRGARARRCGRVLASARALRHLLQRRPRRVAAAPGDLAHRPGRAGRRLVPLLPGSAHAAEPHARLGDAAGGPFLRDARRLRRALPGRAPARLLRGRRAPGDRRQGVELRGHGRCDALPAAAVHAAARQGGRPLRAGRLDIVRGAGRGARRDLAQPDLRAARALPAPGIPRAARLAGRPRLVEADARLLGRRDAARAVREPRPRERQGPRHGPRLAVGDVRGRPRRGGPRRVLPGDAAEAGREFPDREPRASRAATST